MLQAEFGTAREPGVVRGASRDDSAAEWSARSALERRQQPRSGAQPPPTIAQRVREDGGVDRPIDDRSATTGRARFDTPVSDALRSAARGAPSHAAAAPPDAPAQTQPAETPVPPAPSPTSTSTTVAAASVSPAASAASASASSQGGPPTPVAAAASAARRSHAASANKPEAPPRPDPARLLRLQKAFETQLGRGLAQALRSGDAVTLRLKPGHLGELRIDVQVRGNTVSASFEAQRADARTLLEQSREALRAQFEGRGLQVERIEVRLVADADARRDAGTPSAGDERGGHADGRGRSADAERGRDHPTDARGGARGDGLESAREAEDSRGLDLIALDTIA